MKRATLSMVVLIASALAAGQTFPPKPTDTYVADNAGIISAADQAQIGNESRDMLHKTGAPIVVATVTSLSDVNASDIGIESYARKMFDTWKIGAKYANHGILVVVAKADHKARIEFGADWAPEYDSRAHQIMQSAMVPQFKAGDYSTGIRDGVHQLVALTEGIAESSSPSNAGDSQNSMQYQGNPSGDQPAYSGPWGPDSGSFQSDGFNPLLLFAPFACVLIPICIILTIRAAGRSSMRGGFGNQNRTDWNRRNMGNDWNNPNNNNSNGNSPFNNDPTLLILPIDLTSNSFDSSDSSPSSFDSSSSSSDSSSSGGFDSGSSGGGGDTGSW